MSNPSLPPKEDARFPILRADAERNWREWNPKLVRQLEQSNQLNQRLHNAAENAVRLLQEAEKQGLSPDLGQELANEYLFSAGGELAGGRGSRRNPLLRIAKRVLFGSGARRTVAVGVR